jgi:SAM-dependent methyltransferase
MKRYFPGARSLLEIGCGTGFVLKGLREAFPQLRLTGGELYLEGLRYASARLPELELLQFDARRIPFDSAFDVIGAFDVLEHILEDQQVLEEMRTAVRPGGGILITVPQHPWLWSSIDDYGDHKRRYRCGELRSKVARAGFKLSRVTSFMTLLLPAMAAVRLRGRLRPISLDPVRELVTPRHATPILERIMDLESALIARGADLPLGGSLLLVAKRI